MKETSKNEPAAAQAKPLDKFSECHAGILEHLHEFAGLPALLDPAAQARRIAAETKRFFADAILEHHAQEESELFPAVLGSAQPGEERERVHQITDRLTREHRQVEAAWTRIEPLLERIARGRDADLDAAEVASLVKLYEAHARYEEAVFLPLAETILGRDGQHMAALGLALHMRHALPAALARFKHRL